jgi:hypothetical protein
MFCIKRVVPQPARGGSTGILRRPQHHEHNEIIPKLWHGAEWLPYFLDRRLGKMGPQGKGRSTVVDNWLELRPNRRGSAIPSHSDGRCTGRSEQQSISSDWRYMTYAAACPDVPNHLGSDRSYKHTRRRLLLMGFLYVRTKLADTISIGITPSRG